MRVIGVDDATRANVIGSLVIAAVEVKDRRILKSRLIRDSKLLTRKQRDRIVEKMRPKVRYSIQWITPHEIDSMNINDLSAKYTFRALNEFDRFWEAKIYIDLCDPNRELFIKRLKKFMPRRLKNLDMSNWVIEHDADANYKICSLASIFAKYYSDLEYDELKLKYDIGSGLPMDLKTRRFLLKHLYDNHPIIRYKWKTVERLRSQRRRAQN